MSDTFPQHNAAVTIDYIWRVHESGIIDAEEFEKLETTVKAADSLLPKPKQDGLTLEG